MLYFGGTRWVPPAEIWHPNGQQSPDIDALLGFIAAGSGAIAIPTTLVVDGDGIVVFAVEGYSPTLLPHIAQVVKEAIGEQTIPVDVDILPGTEQNRVHLDGDGALTVAVLSNVDFDASRMVDPATLRLAGAPLLTANDRSGPEQSIARTGCQVRDVNRDGLDDLLCLFDAGAVFAPEGVTHLPLEGQTFDGTTIYGEDAVQIVP